VDADQWVRKTARVAAEAVDDHIDCSSQPGVTVTLLDRHGEWRQRLTEEFVFGGGSEVRVTSSYDARFPPELLAAHFDVKRIRTARLVLPFATRPKALLLNLRLTGPGDAPAAMLSRSETAARQAAYLVSLLGPDPSAVRARLAAAAGPSPSVPEADDVRPEIDLLQAICSFTPYRYLEWLKRVGRRRSMEAPGRYVRDGAPFAAGEPAPDAALVESWMARLRPAAETLVAVLDEPPDPQSSSENVLLAIPGMRRPPRNVAGVTTLVDGYADAIARAAGQGNDRFLSVLAEYGRRYEVLAEVDVPVRESFTVRIADDRRLDPHRFGRFPQRFAFADAGSVHLEARVEDHDIHFAKPTMRDLNGAAADSWAEGFRATPETVALYSSEGDRPYYLDVTFRLRVSRIVRALIWSLAAIDVAAAAAILEAGVDDSPFERLALLAVPTTLAAAVVLSREQSALAARLQRPARTVLVVTAIALWTVTLVQVFRFVQPNRADDVAASLRAETNVRSLVEAGSPASTMKGDDDGKGRSTPTAEEGAANR
jgi:hypothetical protein